jgi:hypothetical protein
MTTASTVYSFTPIAIQFSPDAPVIMTTWGAFRAENRDAFTSDELGEMAAEMSCGEPVMAGMAMIWAVE